MNTPRHANRSQSSPSLASKLDTLLNTVAARQTATAATQPTHAPPENQGNPATTTRDRGAESEQLSRRDRFLDKLPAGQQVEILRWAEQRKIHPDESLWLLVDLLGYTQFMTNTLPSQMRAAGQQAVEAIAQQRRAETDAFSANTQKAMNHMLTELAAQVSQASDRITDARLRKRLWQQGLFAASGIAVLASMCFVFGYTFASAHLPWFEPSSANTALRMAQVILGLPIGYFIVPMMLSATAIVLMGEFGRWREKRRWE